ncbi:MAG: SLC13 family permease [Chthoniobacterales bacterium]
MLAVFAVTGVVLVAFVKEWVTPDLVALSALVAVICLGVLDEKDVLNLFSNSAPITIGAMFVLSAALQRTGAIDSLARAFTKAAGKSELRALVLMAVIVIPLSACVNNTPVVVVFLPVLLAFSRSTGVISSKLLMPLSTFAILGGTMTLIGTSTNILVSGVAHEMGQPRFSIFEITKMGAVYSVIGTVYILTVGRKLLPDRQTLSSLLSSEDTRSFCSQAVVRPGSPMIGKELGATQIGKSRTTRVFEVFRGGRRVSDVAIDKLVVEPNDVLVFKAHARGIAAIQETQGLAFDDEHEPEAGTASRSLQLVEAIIGPDSRFIGRTIRNMKLRRRYGVAAAALHRRGQNLFENFQDIPMHFGDTIIFEGPTENISRLREDDDFLSLNETTEKPFRRSKAPIAIVSILAVMLLSAFEIIPIVSAALAGAVVVVLARCLDAREAYASVEWKILFLIVGMLGLGKAMEVTGGAKLIAEAVAGGLADFGPVVVLAAVYLMASILTELVTNNAVAILMTPIVIGIAASMGVDARPFIVAVMFGASASFCSPIGYQTNTYVFGAGGYKFSDFPKIGIPLNLMLWAIAVWLIPIFWEF